MLFSGKSNDRKPTSALQSSLDSSESQSSQKFQNYPPLPPKSSSLCKIPDSKPLSKASNETWVSKLSKYRELDKLEPEPSGKRDRPSACVFVASLCSSMSDDTISQSVSIHFLKWGKLGTVKVLRDARNRPYAFVQFQDDEAASKAIFEGHCSVLDGRHIRCERAKVNRTIFISNYTVRTEDQVRDDMSKFGEVESLLPGTERGNLLPVQHVSSSTFWFVKFVYREDAISAYASLKSLENGKVEWAQNIDEVVANAAAAASAAAAPSAPLSSNEQHHYEREYYTTTIDKYSVFVGHLSPDTTKKDLLDRFSVHGKISEVVLAARPEKNFAFVTFLEENSAARAVEKENHSMFQDRTLHVLYREIPRRSMKTQQKIQSLFLAPPPINFNKKWKTSEYRVPLKDKTNSNIPPNGKGGALFANVSEDNQEYSRSNTVKSAPGYRFVPSYKHNGYIKPSDFTILEPVQFPSKYSHRTTNGMTNRVANWKGKKFPPPGSFYHLSPELIADPLGDSGVTSIHGPPAFIPYQYLPYYYYPHYIHSENSSPEEYSSGESKKKY